MNTNVRRVLVFLLFLISTLVVMWGFWPVGYEIRTVGIYPVDMQLPGHQGDSIAPAVLEERSLILEYPERLRLGDPASMRLTLETAGKVNSTPVIESSKTPGEKVELQDAYDTHFVIAEARLELAGMRYAPAGRISEGLFPGKTARFTWGLHPDSEGDYPGTVWLGLRFVPLDSGPESRAVLTAQLVEIPVVSLFGLNGTWARALGSAGVFVAIVIALDELLPWIWRRYQASRS